MRLDANLLVELKRIQRVSLAKKASSGKKEDRRKLAPIHKGQKRDHLVQKVMDLLRDWRQSPFEHEASCVYGLRSALCLQGYGWHRSDAEARSVVAEGLRLLGPERPSWEQGQREYVTPRENCNWCGVDLPEELLTGTRSVNFCSEVCARSAIRQRDYEGQQTDSYMFRSAWQTIMRTRNDTRPCKNCGVLFRPLFGENEFCSKACVGAFRRTVPDRDCLQCRKRFRPRHGGTLYCSRKCHAASLRTVPMRNCAECGTIFQPHQNRRKDQPICCSRACASALRKRLAPLQQTCQCCGAEYETRSARSLYCSGECVRLVNRFRTGKGIPKTLSPLVFDYITKVAA